jgi:hypothetical protein
MLPSEAYCTTCHVGGQKLEHQWNEWQEKPVMFREKTVQMPLCLPHITHEINKNIITYLKSNLVDF